MVHRECCQCKWRVGADLERRETCHNSFFIKNDLVQCHREKEYRAHMPVVSRLDDSSRTRC